MCTSIAMKTGDFYFGRNMDIDCGFGERIVITPRDYPFVYRKAGRMGRHYTLIGTASVVGGYPLYAEAANEKGLCMAGLNFPDNAYYPKPSGGREISPFELIPWVLGQCADIKAARMLLNGTKIADIPFSKELPLTPLHWHIADKTGSLVLEQTRSGLHIYDNPANVLTNNPPFDFQLANLGQYRFLSPKPADGVIADKLNTPPFGRGLGSFGLPGDYSPASRFVKAAYLLLVSDCNPDEKSSVAQFFHILDSVSVVSGAIEPIDGKRYITTYSCCINTAKGIYYAKSYFNSTLTAVRLKGSENGAELREFPLIAEQEIIFQN